METDSIGRLIKTRRRENDLSQKQLAELLQVSATTISKWETGVNLPDVLILKRMAEELNIPLAKLLEPDCMNSTDDAASTSDSRENCAEEKPEADTSIPTGTEMIDLSPGPVRGGP